MLIQHDPPRLEEYGPTALRAYAITLLDLARYAKKLSRAKELRSQHRIPEAQKLEFELDDMHEQLPRWAQW
jgi:phenylacetate-coenzyme A ligase PaaK-like adenylate-forming protein